MIDIIVKALNKWLEITHLSKDGWFIGRQYEEDTQFNAYKTLIAEIYYHVNNNNHLIVRQRFTVNKSIADDNQKDKLYIALLSTIFSQLDEIKDKVDNVEQMSNIV